MYGMYTVYVFFFKQKTAYEMRISDWSSDVCSSDLKIVRATNGATDLTLCVPLRVSSDYSKLSLASKFGVGVEEAPALLLATRPVADALGICFHVGSQAMTPHAYGNALERVRAAIVAAAVTVDVVDVGGGFSSVYSGMEPTDQIGRAPFGGRWW